MRTIFGGPAHRRATVVIGAVLFIVAVTILSVGANSPYTHANLAEGYDDRYDRTAQIVIGPPGDLERGESVSQLGRGAVLPGSYTPYLELDPVGRGAVLYVTAGCVACHALEGRGGAVAKAIAGAPYETVLKRVRQGTSGMPRFSTSALSDQQVAEIASYLRSLGAAN